MNPNNISNEEHIEDFDIEDQTPSVDDFIQKLEKKEKSLHISSDMVIEVNESEIVEENIHDLFLPNNSGEQMNFHNSLSVEVDANGIVNVSAKDKMTGLEQAMQITPSSGLTPDEIDRLIMDAERSADTDKKSKDIIMQHNKITSLMENTCKALHEFRKIVSPEEVEEFNEALLGAEQELIEDDIEILKMIYTGVEEMANNLSEKLMAAA